jgi:hypothetical protein
MAACKIFLIYFVTLTTGILAATVMVAWVLPVRRRRAGMRKVRFPWKTASYISLSCIPAAIVAGQIWHLHATAVYKLCTLFGISSAHCGYLAKRQKSIPMERLREQDPRPPVLYLRAFDVEEDPFTAPRNDECLKLGIPLRNPNAWRQLATFEEYFNLEIKERIGPFVALGDPFDYLPPAGAARTYVDDSHWQDHVRNLMRESICIAMAPGHSENLMWELESIRKEGLQTKLLVFTRPALAWRWLYSIQWLRSRKGLWAEFASDLQKCGYTPGEDPGEGATFGFDESGKAIILSRDAHSPADYVSTVKGWLKTSDRRE